MMAQRDGLAEKLAELNRHLVDSFAGLGPAMAAASARLGQFVDSYAAEVRAALDRAQDGGDR